MRGISKSGPACLVALALAAGASATVFLDENFNAGTLPAGWKAETSGSGSAYYTFMPGAGGYYLYASVTVPSEKYAKVEITSPPLTIPAGTVYYRIDFSRY